MREGLLCLGALDLHQKLSSTEHTTQTYFLFFYTPLPLPSFLCLMPPPTIGPPASSTLPQLIGIDLSHAAESEDFLEYLSQSQTQDAPAPPLSHGSLHPSPSALPPNPSSPSSSSAPARAPLLPFLTMSLQSVVHTTSHSLVPLLTTRFHLLLRGMIGSDQGDISASLSAGLGRTGSVVKTVLEQGSSWLMYIPLLQEEANDGNELGLRFLVHHLHITADVESGVVAFETVSLSPNFP